MSELKYWGGMADAFDNRVAEAAANADSLEWGRDQGYQRGLADGLHQLRVLFDLRSEDLANAPAPFVPDVTPSHVCDGSDILTRDVAVGRVITAIFAVALDNPAGGLSVVELAQLARQLVDQLDSANIHLADSTRSLQPF